MLTCADSLLADVFWILKVVLVAVINDARSSLGMTTFPVAKTGAWVEVSSKYLQSDSEIGVPLEASEENLLATWRGWLFNKLASRGKVLLPLSLINLTDSAFDVPKFYDASQFPFPSDDDDPADGYNDLNVHLLSLLMKVGHKVWGFGPFAPDREKGQCGANKHSTALARQRACDRGAL